MKKSDIISKIKDLLIFSKVENFLTVSVGTYTIQVEGESFEVGQEVSIVTEDGEIPASSELNGEHIIDNVSITIEEGVIIEVKEVEVEVEKEIATEEEVVELSEEIVEEEVVVEEVLEDAIVEEPIEDTTKEDIKSLQDQVTTLEAKLEALLNTLSGYTNQMESFSSKVDTLWTNTPAETTTVDFKADINSSTKIAVSPLDEIRAIRAKK